MSRAAEDRAPIRTREVESVGDDLREVRRSGAPEFILRFLRAIETEPAPESMLALFVRLDDEANGMQRKHTGRVKWGIRAGTSALCLSIVQLSFREPLEHFSTALFWVEVLAIVISASCFLPEILGRSHHRWLLARYRAEQLRLSKWRLFIEPGLATRSTESLASAIESAVVENDVHEAAELRQRARQEAAVALPGAEPTAAGLRDLLDHYVGHRLEAQIRYFHKKSLQDDRGFFTNPALIPGFFFVTLAFVILHLAFEADHLYGHGGHSTERMSFFCAFVAALIPAVLAGVRTWRSAFEITRNSTRACAKESALAAYRKRLQDPAITPSEAFGVLACCEGLFAQEQGEWLRLMLEAESYM
jgi:hypothetical protein